MKPSSKKNSSMRLTIDLQGAQTDARFWGIGSSALDLVKALTETKGSGDDILIVLNGSLGPGIDRVRNALGGLLPESAFRIWYPPGLVNWLAEGNEGLRKASELIHARFIESLEPGAVLYTSLLDSPQGISAAPSLLQGKCHLSAVIADFLPLRENDGSAGEQQRSSGSRLLGWYAARIEEIRHLSAVFCTYGANAGQAAEALPRDAHFGFSDSVLPEVLRLSGEPFDAAAAEDSSVPPDFSWEKAAAKIWKELRRSASRFEKTDHFLKSPLAPQGLDTGFFSSLIRLIPTLPIQAADALDRTFPRETSSAEANSAPREKQLFVDISEIIRADAGTGIQRVTRSILSHLLRNPPPGYGVRPVYAAANFCGYRYAHNYSLKKFGFDDGQKGDFAIADNPGDFFLGLDFQANLILLQKNAILNLRRRGVRVWFVVYDLIPVQFPQYVRAGNSPTHAHWLAAVAQFDGAICISQAVANDLRDWIKKNVPERSGRCDIRWFHLGSDLEGSVPTMGMPDSAQGVLKSLKQRPTFLMVSTVEPRKGYAQALEAFELLWKNGADVNLAIVGREGWNVRELAQKLRRHREAGKRLFWLKGISDEYLDKVYEAASAVIMASEAEGFGLAVVEGARHQKPLILRDLPVFREIAGESAFYFQGFSSKDLADAVRSWMTLSASGLVPSSAGVERLTWDESAEMLLERLPLLH